MAAEADFLILNRLGIEAELAFLADLAAGTYVVDSLSQTELRTAVDLARRYRDLELGLVDASVIAVCERLGETKVATLDVRDFSAVKPRHCERLRLLPEPARRR